jgi:hypothetical protein
LSLESDGPVKAKSAKLATRIGREVYEEMFGHVRTIGGPDGAADGSTGAPRADPAGSLCFGMWLTLDGLQEIR